jgi:hypothetical protein
MSTLLPSVKVRQIYEFIRTYRHEHSVQTMCRVLQVTRSGYYAWLQEPISSRSRQEARVDSRPLPMPPGPSRTLSGYGEGIWRFPNPDGGHSELTADNHSRCRVVLIGDWTTKTWNLWQPSRQRSNSKRG